MKAIVTAFFLVILFLYGCSSRIFYISAQPEGSLIRHQEYYGYSNVAESGPDAIPYKVLFAGKNSKTSFSAMKRGYYEDTIWVNRESPLKVNFNLVKIAGAENYTDYRIGLSNSNLMVLPPQVDVFLHKGIGNLDKYEKSETQSKEVSKNIVSLLSNEFKDGNNRCRLIEKNHESPGDTIIIPGQIMDYLLSVKPDLLKYYPLPPSLNKLKNWRNLVFGSKETGFTDDTSACIVLVYSRTIKPTAGRIIGNAAASVASAAVSGYQLATTGTSTIIYDPKAFLFDNSTLFMVFYIHPGSGDIIEIKQQSFQFDITGPENQKRIIAELSKLISDI